MSGTKPNRRFTQFAAIPLLAAVLLVSVSNAKADITYTMANYPADQNGYIVGGWIEVTGLGILNSAADFTAWDITMTPPGGPNLELTADNTFIADNVDGVDATATQLVLPQALSQLMFAYQAGGFEGALAYQVGRDGEGGYAAFTPPPGQADLWEVALSGPFGGPGEIGIDPMIIATAVPEPGSLTLLASAMLGIGVVYLRRRRAKG